MGRNSEETSFTMGVELSCDGSGQSVPGFPKTSKPETLGCLSAWDIKVEVSLIDPLPQGEAAGLLSAACCTNPPRPLTSSHVGLQGIPTPHPHMCSFST